MKLFKSKDDLERSLRKDLVCLSPLILQKYDVLDTNRLLLVLEAISQDVKLNELSVPHSLEELVNRMLRLLLFVLICLLHHNIFLTWIFKRVFQPIVPKVSLLPNVAVFVDSKEEGRDEVVSEPYPGVAEYD